MLIYIIGGAAAVVALTYMLMKDEDNHDDNDDENDKKKKKDNKLSKDSNRIIKGDSVFKKKIKILTHIYICIFSPFVKL